MLPRHLGSGAGTSSAKTARWCAPPNASAPPSPTNPNGPNTRNSTGPPRAIPASTRPHISQRRRSAATTPAGPRARTTSASRKLKLVERSTTIAVLALPITEASAHTQWCEDSRSPRHGRLRRQRAGDQESERATGRPFDHPRPVARRTGGSNGTRCGRQASGKRGSEDRILVLEGAHNCAPMLARDRCRSVPLEPQRTVSWPSVRDGTLLRVHPATSVGLVASCARPAVLLSRRSAAATQGQRCGGWPLDRAAASSQLPPAAFDVQAPAAPLWTSRSTAGDRPGQAGVPVARSHGLISDV